MKFSTTLKIAVLCMATVLCMAASGGCGTAVHKATVASGTIAASLRTAATINHSNTQESEDERKAVANFIAQAAAANDDFVDQLKTAVANGDTLSQGQIVAAFQSLLDRVDKMEKSGILQIKNPDAQQKFAATVATIKAQLVLIQSLFSASTSVKLHGDPLQHQEQGGLVMAGGLLLTLAEIDEIIALLSSIVGATSPLIQKLLAMRGQSDAEILDQAKEDNAVAIAQAVADGADQPQD